MAPVRSHKPVRAVRFRLPQPCRSRSIERTLGFEPSDAGANPVSGSSLMKGRSSAKRTAGSYPAGRGFESLRPFQSVLAAPCWPERGCCPQHGASGPEWQTVPKSRSAQPFSGRVAQQVERPVEARRHALVQFQPRPPSFNVGGSSNGKTPDC